jgi:hypothetical protein
MTCPYSSRLEEYFHYREGCLSIFVRRVDARWLRDHGHDSLLRSGKIPYLNQLPSGVMYQYLLASLGKLEMSLHFRRKLRSLCDQGKLGDIRRWFQTADGIIFPLLLSAEDPDQEYSWIDRLNKFSLENCANNYSHFISRMKSMKRLLRKDYAERSSLSASFHDLTTYRKAFKHFFPADKCNPHKTVQYILLWSQTRATGLADSVMVDRSLDKMEQTISVPRRPKRIPGPEYRRYEHCERPHGEPELDRMILSDVSYRVICKIRGETAHVSTGPNACLEATRQAGGQTGAIMRIVRRKCLVREFDPASLEPTVLEVRRPVRSVHDILSWSIDQALSHPTYVRCVRLHAVPEPSKARAITVCSLPYLVIVGVIAKLFQPAIASEISRTGLRGTRNLWEFLYQDLDPTAQLWGKVRDDYTNLPSKDARKYPITAVCSDLSEATDYGDLGVARQILDALITKGSWIPGFPVGVALLAKTLFLGKRFCFRVKPGGVRYFVKRSGWLMGDRLTKVILTLSPEIAVLASGLYCARICGDDFVALHRDRSVLRKYKETILRYGFKLSEEDYFVSDRLMFYCEEGAIPPQTFRELPAVSLRRKRKSCYVDYVRFRLLIPTQVETHALGYTDLGRFSLLGKETRWVHQSHDLDSVALFHRAQLFQHLSVPRPADVICPFIPLEIGGDGSFPVSGEFLSRVVSGKSRRGSSREVTFRLHALSTGKWGFRLVRSHTLDDVVHKYHMLVPKLEMLKEVLPPDSIVEGSELLLGSIKVPGLESPERTFFRLFRAYYWHELLSGRNPPKLELDMDKYHPHPSTEVSLDFSKFFLTWRELGFTFQDTPSYLVRTNKVQVHDYLNLGWSFGLGEFQAQKPSPLGEAFSLNEDSVENFIQHISYQTELNPTVKYNLHRYVEADSYILHQASKMEVPFITLFVSGDVKLARRLHSIFSQRVGEKGQDGPQIILVEPTAYLYGLMDFYEEFVKAYFDANSIEENDRSWITLVDFGAVNYHRFSDPPEFDFPDEGARVSLKPLGGDPSSGIFFASLSYEGKVSRWSLTTMSPDQYRIWVSRR